MADTARSLDAGTKKDQAQSDRLCASCRRQDALGRSPLAHPAKGVLAVRRISQTSVALGYGASPHFVGRVLNGIVNAPPRFRAYVAQLLDLSEGELFYGADQQAA